MGEEKRDGIGALCAAGRTPARAHRLQTTHGKSTARGEERGSGPPCKQTRLLDARAAEEAYVPNAQADFKWVLKCPRCASAFLSRSRMLARGLRGASRLSVLRTAPLAPRALAARGLAGKIVDGESMPPLETPELRRL